MLSEKCLTVRWRRYGGSEASYPGFILHSFRCRSISSRHIAQISSMIVSVGPLALEGVGDKPGSLEIREIVEIYLD